MPEEVGYGAGQSVTDAATSVARTREGDKTSTFNPTTRSGAQKGDGSSGASVKQSATSVEKKDS